jgi:stage II sporulation protein D
MKNAWKRKRFRKIGLMIAGAFLFAGVVLFLWFGAEDEAVSARLYEQMYAENLNTGSVLKNVLLMGCTQADGAYTLDFLWNGIRFTYPVESDLSPYTGEIADVTLQSGVVQSVGLKTTRVRAKVLAVSEEYAQLEGLGVFEFTQGFQMYAVYDEAVSQTKEEILLGYDNQEFVLEDGKICAALTVEAFEVDQIRVLLKTTGFSSIFHDQVTLYCEQDYLVQCGDSEILVNGGETITIVPDSLYFADGLIRVQPVEEGEIFISSIERAGGVPGYEGSIELRSVEGGIVIVNEVSLEEYLKRVVPSEMPPSYGLETAKVQAVCARSFAYRQIQNRTAEFGVYAQYGAHVDDSISFQVYNNSGENAVSTQAVLETTGQVLTYQGNVIGTYYFSTSCGVTTDLSIWNDNPAAAPYIVSQEVSVEAVSTGAGNITLDSLQEEEAFESFIRNVDPDALEAAYPWYRWSFQVGLEELSRRINEKLAACYDNNPSLILVQQEDGSFTSQRVENIGQLVSLTVLSRGSGGVINQLLIEGTEQCVVACKQGNVRALLGDASQIYSNGLTNTTSGTDQLPSAFCFFEGIYEGDVLTGYTIYGGGNGHGVGMSQNATKELADAGFSYTEILEYFYAGAEVVNAEEL